MYRVPLWKVGNGCGFGTPHKNSIAEETVVNSQVSVPDMRDILCRWRKPFDLAVRLLQTESWAEPLDRKVEDVEKMSSTWLMGPKWSFEGWIFGCKAS